MSLGSDREIAQNKLILLYLIDRINIPVSNLQVTKIILENKFMNYFYLQQFLKELSDGAMLSFNQSEGKTIYSITAKGKQTLEYFPEHIPTGIKSRIDETINVVRKNIKNETLITADYTCEYENEFIVTCKVREDNFPLMEISVTVGSKIDARAICDNWNQHSQTIYSDIITTLTKNRKPQA